MQRVSACLAVLLAFAGLISGQNESVLENSKLRLVLQSRDASVQLTDKATGREWDIGAPRIVRRGGGQELVRIRGSSSKDSETITYSSADGTRFRLRLLSNPAAIEYSFEPGADVEEARLLDKALAVDSGENNYYAVPFRLGILLRAEGEKAYTRRFPAYSTSGYSMAMFGAVKNGSALLVTWEDPYTGILVDYAAEPKPLLELSLPMRKSARSIRLQPLGRGGYVEIARAYRETARRRGFLKTLADKVKQNPAVGRLFGAADFKPFVFTRYLPNTRWNPKNETVLRIRYTFEEAARVAEHLKNDLGIDRALFVLAGWINGGYDNRHPDVLPAAPEIGGDGGLKECSRRVRALGEWLFGLHDNYQDFYREAPSWSEDFIMRNPDGSLRAGGIWAGGQAYLICSKKSLELAMRPQNIPRVRELFLPDVYFYDTIFAAQPYECFDPKHPLTLADDIREKQKISAEIRKSIGLFASEEGKEWAVPYSDYFEGLMSHRTRFGKPPDPIEIIVPLFELVYGDAVPLYSHQSDRPRPDNPVYILDHILCAEMPVYEFGEHLYWTDPSKDFHPPEGAGARLVFAQGGRFGLTDQFIKNTYEVLSPLHRVTALLPMTDHRFLTKDRQVEWTRFGSQVEVTVNYGPADFTTKNAVLPQYGFLVESPTLTAYYARRYRGLSYRTPSLLVLRSLDGRPLTSSRRVRVYRGFGERTVEWNGELVEVETERILTPGRTPRDRRAKPGV